MSSKTGFVWCVYYSVGTTGWINCKLFLSESEARQFYDALNDGCCYVEIKYVEDVSGFRAREESRKKAGAKSRKQTEV